VEGAWQAAGSIGQEDVLTPTHSEGMRSFRALDALTSQPVATAIRTHRFALGVSRLCELLLFKEGNELDTTDSGHEAVEEKLTA
jgi:hypothetical protein